MRIVQISDTHLTAAGGVPARNLARVAAYVNQLRPDLVVHTGDVVALSPDSDEDRLFARAAHTAFDAPIRFLPGNHDVGDPGADPWMGFGVTPERLAAHQAVFGDDQFAERVEGWTIVGVDSELFGSGLVEEERHWAWLEETLAGHEVWTPVLLFLHRPLWAPEAAPPAVVALSLRDADRARLLSLRGADRIRAVASGHLHRYRQVQHAGLLTVWGSSLATAAPVDGTEGLGRPGVIEWRLESDSLEARFCLPAGLEEFEFDDIRELRSALDMIERPGRDKAAPEPEALC